MDGQKPTVIVPVFNAVQSLEPCLDALLATLPSDTRVLLVDDASSDPAVLPSLTKYVEAGGVHWRLLARQMNGGFVATVNQAMQSCSGDVVLLNSDTLPAGDWFSRLCECAAAVVGLATATPWTNNGEIVSLPKFCQANPLPADANLLATMLHENFQPEYPEIPTAVGFCMYITRNAIDSIGLFDLDTFGVGYGEENDFSLRARSAGLRNVLCDNAWVGHIGNQSFGPRGMSASDESMQRLLKKHPDYIDIISAYIEQDPLRRLREKIVLEYERHTSPVV